MASVDEILANLERIQNKQKVGVSATSSARPAVVTRRDVYKEAFAKGAKPQKAAEPGGWKGFVGDVLDSPIGTVLKGAGEVLSVPGRVATSALKEGIDIVDPNADASWDDFFTQVKDPTFGFGKITGDLTGNKWIDRAIGFIGDVALDPLTYVTLGTSKFAGAGGRLSLAKLAADAGIDAEKVARVVRYGRSALDADDIANLGVNRAGLYMFGKRIKGTGKVGEITEDAMSNMRVFLSDSRMGRALQKGFTPRDFKELRLAAMRGDVPPEKIRDTLVVLTSRDTQRQAGARASIEGQRRVTNAIAEAKSTGELETVRKSLYKLLDNDDLAASASPVLQRAHARWRGILDSMHDDVMNVMKSIDGVGDNPFGYRESYFPRFRTDAAMKWMQNTKNKYANQILTYIDDPLSPTGVFNHRKLKEGSEWFGTILKKEDLNTDRLNELARAGGFVGDFFETDLLVVMEKYIKEWADQMGLAARFKEIADAGVMKNFTQKGITSVVVDEAAVAAQKKVLKDADDALRLARIQLLDSLQQSVEVAVSGRAAAQTTVGEARAAATAATRVAETEADRLARAAAGVEAAERNLDIYRQTMESLMLADGSVPIAAGPTIRRMEDLKQQLVTLKEDLARAIEEENILKSEFEAATGAEKKAIGDRIKETRKTREKTLKDTQKRFDDGVQDLTDQVNYNMLIADNYQAIRDGVQFTGKTGDILNEVAGWLAYQPLSPQRRGRKGLQPVAGGSLADYVKGVVGKSEWFKGLTSKSKISSTTVANYKGENVPNAVAGLLDDPAEYLNDGRTAGLWAVARDEKNFGGEPPVVLAAARNDLLDSLSAAEDAAVSAVKSASSNASVRSANVSQQYYGELKGVVDEIEPYAERLKKFTDITDNLQSRGLSESELPLAQEDKLLLVDALRTEGTSAQRATGEAVDDDMTDLIDDYDPQIDIGTEGDSMGRIKSEKAVQQQQLDSAFAKAVQEAVAGLGPNATYADLYRAISGIENAINTRVWEVGQGAARQTYRVRDAMVRLGSQDGKSVVRRALDEMEQKQGVLAAAMRGATPDQAGVQLARSVSMYYILSEVNDRFLRLAGALAPLGAQPTKEMLADLMTNVSRPFIQLWEAKVAKLAASKSTEQLDEAKRVLAALKAAADNPSEDYYSHLLGDAGTRMGNAGSQVQVARTSGLSPKARQKMDAGVDSLQEMKADPRYTKALHDKEMVDAMDDLAGYDLYNHTLPDGTKGFLVQNADGSTDLLKMPDGTPLFFEEAEWEALFKKAGTTNEASTKRLAVLDGEIEKNANVLNRARAKVAEIERKRLRGTATLDDIKALNEYPPMIKRLQDQVAGLQAEAQKLRAAVAAEDPATRAMALAKVRILVNGNADQAGWWKPGLILDDLPHPSATDVAARRTNLSEAWKATTEGKYMAQVEEAAARSSAVGSQSLVEAPEAVARQSEKLIEAADEAGRKAVAEETAGAGERTVSKAESVAQRMRNARSTRRKSEGAVAKVERQLEALGRSLETIRDRAVASIKAKADRTAAKLPSMQETLNRAQAAFDQAEAVRVSKQEIVDTVIPDLEDTIRLTDEIIAGTVDLPQTRIKGRFGPKYPQAAVPEDVAKRAPGQARQRARMAERGETMKPKVSPEEAAELLRWARGARRAIDAYNADPDSPLARVLLAASQAESRFLMATVTANQERNVLRMLQKGDVVETINSVIDDGFASLEAIGLPRQQMPADLVEVLTNVRQMKQPQVAQFLNRFIGRYTKFFKAYATLSPGFHVRNAIGNTVMVFAAGASPKNMSRGLQIYTSFVKAIRENVAVDDWLAQTAKEVSPQEFKHIEIAIRAAEAAGGGRIEEAFADFARRGQRLSDNALLRRSRKAGERVEGSGRFMLAYDSAVKGLDFNASTARVKRYLFDYQDVGTLDETMRQIIPFWMWMSRNLPLQIVNQWTEPRTYNIYNNFMKNFGDDDSGDVVPKWIKQQGAIKVGEGWYLSFDVGFNRLGEQLELLATPSRILKDVNPILRVIPEVTLLDKKLYRGTPFSDRPQEIAGGVLSPAVAALSKLLGQQTILDDGSEGTTDKLNYAIMNFLPTAGQAERLLPSTEFYENRQLGSWLSYLGLPLRQVTEDAREAELRRRAYEGE